jgi:hypothetical protein
MSFLALYFFSGLMLCGKLCPPLAIRPGIDLDFGPRFLHIGNCSLPISISSGLAFLACSLFSSQRPYAPPCFWALNYNTTTPKACQEEFFKFQEKF